MNPRGTITLMLLLVFALSVGLISRSPSGGASGMPDARGKNAAQQQYDHGGNGSSGGGGGGQRDSADGEDPAGVAPAGPGLAPEMVSMGLVHCGRYRGNFDGPTRVSRYMGCVEALTKMVRFGDSPSAACTQQHLSRRIQAGRRHSDYRACVLALRRAAAEMASEQSL